MTRLGLGDQGIVDGFLTVIDIFLIQCVQTVSAAHPVSYSMGTGACCHRSEVVGVCT